MSLTPREIAVAFVRTFCEGDVEGLESLLHPDLQFVGPLLECSSRGEYLAGLRGATPEPCSFTLRSIVEEGDEVALLYDYEKASGAITIAQWCRFRDGVIADLRLVFDTAQLGST